tara:strand:+ start:389 stop:520 length:132 start_codon:yes stop_codon:yes gene_type:complete
MLSKPFLLEIIIDVIKIVIIVGINPRCGRRLLLSSSVICSLPP